MVFLLRALSQHLKVLRNACLIRVRIDAQRRIYKLDSVGFQGMEVWLARIKRFWNHHLEELEYQLRKPDTPNKRKRKQ